MRVPFERMISASVAMLIISACGASHKGAPRYTVTYYDRNGDGIVDLEVHTAGGTLDADWGFIDPDYNGAYDILFGPGAVPSTKVLVPVPGGVRISKQLPDHLRAMAQPPTI